MLLDVICRGLVRQAEFRDLLANVIVGGMVGAVSQLRQKVLTGHSFKLAAVIFAVAGNVVTLIAIAAARILR
jgi:hypothetical protein